MIKIEHKGKIWTVASVMALTGYKNGWINIKLNEVLKGETSMEEVLKMRHPCRIKRPKDYEIRRDDQMLDDERKQNLLSIQIENPDHLRLLDKFF